MDMGGEEQKRGDMYVGKSVWRATRVNVVYLAQLLLAPSRCIAGSSPGLTAALGDTVVSEIYT